MILSLFMLYCAAHWSARIGAHASCVRVAGFRAGALI